jgi:hypothetical protein
MHGTLDQCVRRWLSLPGHLRQNCELSCGCGRWSPTQIGAFVRENGLPPSMAAECGGQPNPERLAQITAIERYEPAPGSNAPAIPHSTPPLGAADG